MRQTYRLLSLGTSQVERQWCGSNNQSFDVSLQSVVGETGVRGLDRCQDTRKQIGILGQVHCSVGTDVLSGQSCLTSANMVGMDKVASPTESVQYFN